jgi:hypothetical protein
MNAKPSGRQHVAPFEIVEFLPNELALVSTKGRFRVYVDGTGEILSELVGLTRAKKIASYFDNKNPGQRALIISYAEGAKPIAARHASPSAAVQAPRFRMGGVV